MGLTNDTPLAYPLDLGPGAALRRRAGRGAPADRGARRDRAGEERRGSTAPYLRTPPPQARRLAPPLTPASARGRERRCSTTAVTAAPVPVSGFISSRIGSTISTGALDGEPTTGMAAGGRTRARLRQLRATFPPDLGDHPQRGNDTRGHARAGDAVAIDDDPFRDRRRAELQAAIAHAPSASSPDSPAGPRRRAPASRYRPRSRTWRSRPSGTGTATPRHRPSAPRRAAGHSNRSVRSRSSNVAVGSTRSRASPAPRIRPRPAISRRVDAGRNPLQPRAAR